MRSLVPVAAIAILSSLIAHADTVVAYKGNNFTDVTKPYTTSETAVGSFTIAGALAPNMNGSTQMYPAQYSFSDGPDSFVSGAPLNQGYVYLYTDAAGHLVDFYLSLNLLVPISSPGAYYVKTLDIAYGPTIATTLGTFASDENGGHGFSFTQGTATITTTANTTITPEPSSIALLGTGVLGLAGVVRRRLA